MSTSKKSNHDALAEQFASITGASKAAGLRLLEVCNGDLQRAISMHLDGVLDANDVVEEEPKNASPQYQDTAGPSIPPDDTVRAPIPKKRDVLMQDIPAFGPRPRQRGSRSVFDGLRDFRAETRQQEEMLRTFGTIQRKSTSKKRTLEDLFRPPLDLMHKGTFLTAREAGQTKGKWLMVNVQNVREFSCQQLNRDVWSDSTVKSIIRESFIFWQVYHDSEEGLRYMQFYKVREFPYVSILDPRTGEQMATWHKVDNMAFCDVVMQFLSDHKMVAPDVVPLTPPGESSSGPAAKRPRSDSIIDASEESQIEAAIAASLAESVAASSQHKSESQSKTDTNVISVDSDSENEDDVIETIEDDFAFSDSDALSETGAAANGAATRTSENVRSASPEKAAEGVQRTGGIKCSGKAMEKPTTNGRKEVQPKTNSASYDVTDSGDKKLRDDSDEDEIISVKDSDTLSSHSGPTAKVMLRFPDGRKKQVCLPASTTLMTLVKLVAKEGFSNERYELITNFPRRRLSILDFDTNLSDAGLSPQESVFVQER